MEKLKKPPFVKPVLVRHIMVSCTVLLVGCALVCYSLWGSIRYRYLMDVAEEVTATIYHVEETTDVDDYDVYEVYVRYDYKGKTYTKRHLSAYQSSWLDRVGQTITITIDPENPTEEVKDIEYPMFFSMFFGLPVFCLGLVLLPVSGCRLSYVEMYGLRSSAIRADLI